MKKLICAGLLNVLLVCGALAQPLTGYTNTGFVTTSRLVIDATNVVNLGVMDFSLTDSAGPFGFSDVQTYTNRNVMYSTTGFLFNNSPASFGIMGPSVNFVNQNPGQIYGGALDIPVSLTLLGSGAAPRVDISAINITNSGVLQVGQNGEISASGSSLDLSHGSTLVEGFDQVDSGAVTGGTVLGPGEFIQLWGAGVESNNFFFQNLSTTLATSATSRITNFDYSTGIFTITLGNASAIAFTNALSASNIYTQAVIFVDGGGSGVNMQAFFLPAVITPILTNSFRPVVVQWGVQLTNAFGQVVSNALFLTDDLGSLPTNVTFVTNNTLGGLAQLVPTNYTLGPTFRGGALNNTGNVPFSMSLFTNGFGTNGTGSGQITNIYATFEVNLAPVTAEPNVNVAGSTVSNLPGRVVISAGQSLNMAGSILNAGNYLNLTSPNDFRGSQGAQITFPFADINLGSSNGQMTISNLAIPYLTRFNGPVFAWSAAWTNLTSATQIVAGTNGPTTNTFTVTNAFMVTMVGSDLQATAPVNIESLALRSTNLVISDSLNVNTSMLIDAQNLTITSNTAEDATPSGQLVFDPLNEQDLFSANFPSMLNFTNFGLVETINAAFFQVRQNPNFPSAGDGPWQSIVNHGQIASPGDLGILGGGFNFWANDFENTGLSPSAPAVIQTTSAFGPIFIQSSTALVTNSFIVAVAGDMQLTSGSVTINNAALQAAGFLNLAATNLLSDVTTPGVSPVANGNNFSAGDGFSLLTAPTSLSGLLGTSVTSSCRTNAQCENIWAGVPVTLPAPGSLPTMANNVPIGQLILNGGNNNSVFHFKGPDSVNPYAMYVDQIELQGGATNFAGGKYTTFKIDPNVTVFFLKASSGATDISAKLSTNVVAGGGHLTWLSNYVGHFSVTHVTYADGETFAVNSAYVQNYGLPPEPPVVLTPQTILLNIGTTNVASTPMASISWYAPALSTNTLYYRTLTNPNWLVRTNFIQGATSGRVSCLDSLGTSHLYRVSVAPTP